MVTDRVRMWRPAHEDRVLLMEGQTTHYSIEPQAEYVFGVVTRQPMRSHRGRKRRLVHPGQLVAWDPTSAHAGTAVDGRPWTARLMVVEVADLTDLASDHEDDPLTDVTFPEPVISQTELVHGFLRLHSALKRPASRLEQDEQLALWLRTLVRRTGVVPVPRPLTNSRDERALRLVGDYLGDRPERNVSLDELAAAAGIGKFRLVRLVRERTGLPPHALQLAHRVRLARRLLEAGQTITETAAATGFADQSHLHRHFQRSLGVTPGEYRRRLRHEDAAALSPVP